MSKKHTFLLAIAVAKIFASTQSEYVPGDDSAPAGVHQAYTSAQPIVGALHPAYTISGNLDGVVHPAYTPTGTNLDSIPSVDQVVVPAQSNTNQQAASVIKYQKDDELVDPNKKVDGKILQDILGEINSDSNSANNAVTTVSAANDTNYVSKISNLNIFYVFSGYAMTKVRSALYGVKAICCWPFNCIRGCFLWCWPSKWWGYSKQKDA